MKHHSRLICFILSLTMLAIPLISCTRQNDGGNSTAMTDVNGTAPAESQTAKETETEAETEEETEEPETPAVPLNILLKDETVNFRLDYPYEGTDPWENAISLVREWTKRWKTIRRDTGDADTRTIEDDTDEYKLPVMAAEAAKTDGSSTRYNTYYTRTLDTVKGFAPTDESGQYDVYGGYTGGKKYDATGFFRTEYDDGRWWGIDPLGYPFFRTAVVSIEHGSPIQQANLLKQYATLDEWANDATKRLRELGFNSAGGWSDIARLSKAEQPLAQTSILYLMRDYANQLKINKSGGGSTTLANDLIPAFDPAFIETAKKSAQAVEAYADAPYVYGWMTDNELPAKLTMFDSALSLDPTQPECRYTYAVAWTFLVERTGNPAASKKDVTDELRQEYRAMVYDRYFKVAKEAVETYDKNHLFLGCRFLRDCFRDEYVMKVAGYWCDAITINYYKAWTPSSDFLHNVGTWTHAPIIVTEWYAKGMDACTAESRLTNKSGAGWTVKTQDDRGKFYQNYGMKLMESGVCIGFDWFKYWDNDPDNLSADTSNRDSNKGMYNTAFEEYTVLTDRMKALNLCKYHLIDYFDQRY